MLCKSNEKNISNIINFLADKGTEEANIATGLFKGKEEWYENITNNLQDVNNNHDNLQIGSMLTYHHYFPNQTEEQLAKTFNKSIKGCSKFSDEIVISVLGDNFYEKSLAENVENTFIKNSEKIFKGFEIIKNEEHIVLKRNGKETKISIPPPSNTVYPLGRLDKPLRVNIYVYI